MVSQNLKVGQQMEGFTLTRVVCIPELRSEAAIFTHDKTGASLLHLFNEDKNNLFSICFRTPVSDNTGVPHIIEHSVLSGSKRYPIKDPFKEMLKGSLYTFLNALTYPDKTVYPVSSQVERDFFNLVDVYCDAVFNPLLTEITFAQEGWHFECDAMDKPVTIGGIVYNEMKGVFSDFRSHVARRAIGRLFPDTTYRFESGGEPEAIPDLTYEQFKEFHRRYYHPSNACIFLYGNIPSVKSLAILDQRYLSCFQYAPVDSQISPQLAWSAPQSYTFTAPSSVEDDATASVIVSWAIGKATDPHTMFIGKILSHYLFDNECSPLRRSLIDSRLGEDLDDMCGFDSDLAQGIFSAGLAKTKPEHTAAVEKVVLDTIRKEISTGLDKELLEGSIRQIEFALREITEGGHFPYNLSLAERAYRSWLYGGDPLVHLQFESVLSWVRERMAADPGFFASKMQEFFIDNPHRLVMSVIASSAMGELLGKKSEEQAKRLSAGFTEADKRECISFTKKLREAQKKEPTPEQRSKIPRIDRADLPRENEKVDQEKRNIGSTSCYLHPVFSGGIAYLDIGFSIADLPEELLPYLPLYSEMLTRCGSRGLTPGEMAKRISLSTGGVQTVDIVATRFGTSNELVFYTFLQSKALVDRFDDMTGILRDLLEAPHLDDSKLVKEILMESRNELSNAVIRSGNSFAQARGLAALSVSGYIDETLDGISQLRFLDATIKQNNMNSVVKSLEQVHAWCVNRGSCVVSLTADEPDRFMNSLTNLVGDIPVRKSTAPVLNKISQMHPANAVEINSSVNYCAHTWGLKSLTPEAMGHYFLMARNLSTGFLWDRIRVEGGAYGGSASINGSHPAFSCTSYRDPHIARTLELFKKSVEYVAAGLSEEDVDQNVIGTIGRFDQPRSPHSKGFGELIALLSGRSVATRQAIRDSVLACTSSSLANFARGLLAPDIPQVTTVLGSVDALDKAGKEGVILNREKLLQ